MFSPSPAEFGHLQNDENWECSIASPKAKMGSQLVVGDLSGDIVKSRRSLMFWNYQKVGSVPPLKIHRISITP
jgi:hypothetical protein